MAVNVKNLYGNSGKRFKLINTRYRMFNKIQLTVFTSLVFVFLFACFYGKLYFIEHSSKYLSI